MQFKSFSIYTILLLFFMVSCGNPPKEEKKTEKKVVKDSVTKLTKKDTLALQKTEPEKPKTKEDDFRLTDDNVIKFLHDYEKTLTENKVRIKTKYGNIDIELFENTPYHRANFIYLTKKKYFDSTCFHRVVADFIIQGGNTDSYKTSRKRAAIGNYLLPPDTKKGHKHDRGIISMPSSNIDNPYKFASPFEFFIVAQKPGAYHLDGDYTAFGRVIAGMDVVDTISHLRTDAREWPYEYVYMTVEILK